MATVAATLSLKLDVKERGSNDLGTPSLPFGIDKTIEINPAALSALDQANTLFADKRTLASGATENLDMTGALTDAFGASILNAEVTMLYFENPRVNTTNITVFGAASNGFNAGLTGTTPKVTLMPGEWIIMASRNGWGVTAGTGDLILVANSAGASADYIVVALGRTVAA